MQSLGLITPEISRLDLNGLGYASDYDNGGLHPGNFFLGLGMNDSEAQAVGRSLVGKTWMNIQSALSILGEDDKKKVIVAYLAAGGDAAALQTAMTRPSYAAGLGQVPTWLKTAWAIAAAASMAASAYHGYKRNDSLGWALWWGLMGSLFPVVTPTIAVAQGFAKRRR